MEPYVALNKSDTVIYLLGTDGSIDYSILSLPVRYPFFRAYLAVLVYCLVSFLCWLILNAFRILPNTICCLLSRYRMQNLSNGGEEWCKMRQRMTPLETNTVRTSFYIGTLNTLHKAFSL